jgi:hypothetical protein
MSVVNVGAGVHARAAPPKFILNQSFLRVFKNSTKGWPIRWENPEWPRRTVPFKTRSCYD